MRLTLERPLGLHSQFRHGRDVQCAVMVLGFGLGVDGLAIWIGVEFAFAKTANRNVWGGAAEN